MTPEEKGREAALLEWKKRKWKSLRAFLSIEKAFWHRAIFVKPLMMIFMLGMPAYVIAQLYFSPIEFLSIWWWFGVVFTAFTFYVVLPMILYLIDPKTFFPNEGK